VLSRDHDVLHDELQEEGRNDRHGLAPVCRKFSGAYYYDHDQGARAVLRELIKRELIPDREVDERSVLDVRPVDLAGFNQCHFFTGIGGWGTHAASRRMAR